MITIGEIMEMFLFVFIIEALFWTPIFLISYIYIEIRDRAWYKWMEQQSKRLNGGE